MSTNLYAVPQEEKGVTIAVKMPAALREAFKAHCAKYGVDMSLVIRNFMTAELAKTEAELKDQMP